MAAVRHNLKLFETILIHRIALLGGKMDFSTLKENSAIFPVSKELRPFPLFSLVDSFKLFRKVDVPYKI